MATAALRARAPRYARARIRPLTDNLYLTMSVPLAIGAALLALLLLLQRRRWFARFRNGVFLSASATLVCLTLVCAATIGTWGYGAARRIMRAETSASLNSIASIVQQEIDLEIRRGTSKLTGLTRAVLPALAPRGDLKDLTSSLQAIQNFNPHYLEFDVLDAAGTLVASSEPLEGRQPPDRIATAFNMEGKAFVSAPRKSARYNRETIYMSVPVFDSSAHVTGAVGSLLDLQSLFDEVIGTARFNESGYAVILDATGRIIAHPDSSRVGQDLSQYAAVREAARLPSGELTERNAAGQMRRFMFRQVRNPQTIDPKPWLLLTEIDEAEALRPLRQLRDELAAGLLVVLALSVLMAWNAARALGAPLRALEQVANAVEQGDLTRTAPVSGQDAFARLGGAIHRMVKGLQERDHVKDVFGKYIAKQAAEQLLQGPLDLGGVAKTVTILFSDIRGFTSMAESMTPEQVVTFLNDYFSEMVEAVMSHGGILDKYLGDGMMAVFGSFGDQPDHAHRAVLAGLRMKALLAKINGERAVTGKAPIQIGIGIHTGEVVVGNIGSRQRLEFTHIGDCVNTASRVQALNKQYHTTLLITESTYQAVGASITVRPVAEVTLRGKTGALPIYEVVSAQAPAAAPPVRTAGV